MKLLHLVLSLAPSLMFVYLYVRLRSAIGPGWRWTLAYSLLSAALLYGSYFLWTTDLGEWPQLRKVLSYSVYMLLALAFLMFAAFLALDAMRLLLWAADHLLSSTFGSILRPPRLRAAAAVSFALLACAYGWYEALSVRPASVTVVTDRLPAGVDRIRIAHLTDVHLGWFVQEQRLERILEVVRGASPDLLVCTGDLVDGNMEEREQETALLRALEPPLGKIAVTGNHEYHAGVEQAVRFMERAGMRVLRGETVAAGGIVVVGVDDPAVLRHGERPAPESELLASLPPDRFVLLLKHQPTVSQGSEGLFDLQLSGHTHGGQIWPFYWATRAAYDYRPGLRALKPRASGEAQASAGGRESAVLVSNGAGTWGPPIRFMAPPEVVIVDLVRGVDE